MCPDLKLGEELEGGRQNIPSNWQRPNNGVPIPIQIIKQVV